MNNCLTLGFAKLPSRKIRLGSIKYAFYTLCEQLTDCRVCKNYPQGKFHQPALGSRILAVGQPIWSGNRQFPYQMAASHTDPNLRPSNPQGKLRPWPPEPRRGQNDAPEAHNVQ